MDCIQDEIQLVVSGTAVPLVDPDKTDPDSSCTDTGSTGHNTPSPLMSGGTPPSTGGTPPMPHDNGTGDADDDIFTLDEEQLVKNNQQLEAYDEKNLLFNGQVGAIGFTTTLTYSSLLASPKKLHNRHSWLGLWRRTILFIL